MSLVERGTKAVEGGFQVTCCNVSLWRFCSIGDRLLDVFSFYASSSPDLHSSLLFMVCMCVVPSRYSAAIDVNGDVGGEIHQGQHDQHQGTQLTAHTFSSFSSSSRRSCELLLASLTTRASTDAASANQCPVLVIAPEDGLIEMSPMKVRLNYVPHWRVLRCPGGHHIHLDEPSAMPIRCCRSWRRTTSPHPRIQPRHRSRDCEAVLCVDGCAQLWSEPTASLSILFVLCIYSLLRARQIQLSGICGRLSIVARTQCVSLVRRVKYNDA